MRFTSPARTLAAIACWSMLAGCAGYAGEVKEIRSALLAGDKALALERTNEALEVDATDQYPEDLDGDVALLVCERATVKQGLGLHEGSAADFRVADKHLELLDLQNDTAGEIAKFVFSDDATVYKAPAYEKLLLNTFNMINYLALGDLEGARVEARRLKVMQDYLADEQSEQAAALSLGAYLSGFTYEMSGRAEEALRSYESALGTAHPSLVEPVRRLAACDGYRSAAIEAVIGDPEGLGSCQPMPVDRGTLLVVATSGLAPHKVARRIPIGAALVIAASATHGPGLGVGSSRQANELAAKGLLTFINFPTMERTPSRFRRMTVAVDGERQGTELGLDVTERVIRAWDSIKGTLMVAAITRMITRAVAGEAAQRGAQAGGAAGGLALLAGLAVQGALTAADTPDTRSWVTLPSRVFLSRVTLPPGRHELQVTYSGGAGTVVERRTVDVPAGGFAVVPVAAMR